MKSAFRLNGVDLVYEQYELIDGGAWPKAYNEIVLVVNENNELDDKFFDKRLSNDDKLNKRLKTYFDFDKDKFTWETRIYKYGNNITANFNIRDHTNNRVIYIQYSNDYHDNAKMIKLRMLSPQHIKNNFPELYQDKYVKNYRKIVNKIKRDFKDSFLSVEDSAGQFKTFFIPIK